MNSKDNGYSKLSVLFVTLIVLVVAAAASFSVYEWQHGKVSNLNNELSQQNSKISDLNQQVSSLSSQINKACQSSPSPTCAGYSYASLKGVSIMVFSPAKNSTVSSPVVVIGEVPGNWSFEAEFPIKLIDSSGAIVSQTPAHLIGNWQTSALVPFSAQLTYTGNTSGTGSLVLQKDNPSGLTKNEDSLTIPIKF